MVEPYLLLKNRNVTGPGLSIPILGIHSANPWKILTVRHAVPAAPTPEMSSSRGAAFDVDAFDHEARWNARLARIEMHLVSKTAQEIVLGGTTVSFSAGESIHTENSHKYTRDSVDELATTAGWRVDEFLMDDDALFAVTVLGPGR